MNEEDYNDHDYARFARSEERQKTSKCPFCGDPMKPIHKCCDNCINYSENGGDLGA